MSNEEKEEVTAFFSYQLPKATERESGGNSIYPKCEACSVIESVLHTDTEELKI